MEDSNRGGWIGFSGMVNFYFWWPPLPETIPGAVVHNGFVRAWLGLMSLKPAHVLNKIQFEWSLTKFPMVISLIIPHCSFIFLVMNGPSIMDLVILYSSSSMPTHRTPLAETEFNGPATQGPSVFCTLTPLFMAYTPFTGPFSFFSFLYTCFALINPINLVNWNINLD